ncbi:hypothetical protein ACQPZ2_28540 [Nocardia pseudovaccinii]|uniref:hypothetical protein n=1 Tax=Nocardia pseudovaccinii TaxID=189540 RepID=UPI003D8D4524
MSRRGVARCGGDRHGTDDRFRVPMGDLGGQRGLRCGSGQVACSVYTQVRGRARIDRDALAATFADRCEPYRGYGGGTVVVLHEIRDGRPWNEAAGAAFGGRGSWETGPRCGSPHSGRTSLDIARQSEPVEVIFDYLQSADTDEDRAQLQARAHRAAAVGEPWFSYFTPDDIAAQLRALGFTDVEDHSAADLIAGYLNGSAEFEGEPPQALRPVRNYGRAAEDFPEVTLLVSLCTECAQRQGDFHVEAVGSGNVPLYKQTDYYQPKQDDDPPSA